MTPPPELGSSASVPFLRTRLHHQARHKVAPHRARRKRVGQSLLLAAAVTALSSCYISSVSGPSDVVLGQLASFVVEYTSSESTTHDAWVAVEVPSEWEYVENSYSGTAAGTAVSGTASLVADPAGLVEPLSMEIKVGYRRLYFRSATHSISSGDKIKGKVTFVVHGTGGQRELVFWGTRLGAWQSTPVSKPVTVHCVSPAWQTVAGSPSDLVGLTHANGNYIGVGFSIRTSSDGNSWTSVLPAVPGDHLVRVAMRGDRYVAVGYSGLVMVSANGTGWSQVAVPTPAAKLEGIACNGTRWVATGETGTVLLSSGLNGSSWSKVAVPTSAFITSVVWTGTRFVAVGASGTVLTSDSAGTSWAATTIPNEDWLMDVAWNGSQLLVASYDGSILASADGTTWIGVAETGRPLLRLLFTGARYVAAGNFAGILSSWDGTQWSQESFEAGAPPMGVLTGIASDGSQLAAVGESCARTLRWADLASVQVLANPNTPNIGQAVTFSSSSTAGLTHLRYDFGENGCDNLPAVIDICGCDFNPCMNTLAPVTFKYASSGTKNVKLYGEDPSGNIRLVTQRTVTVNASGSCVVCVAPSGPVPTSPANGATVAPGTVIFSWSAASGTVPVNYTVRDSFGVTLCGTVSTSCSAQLGVTGTLNWSVRASNACGTASSAVQSLTVAACAASTVPAADFTITPTQDSTISVGGYAQKQPYVGQAVTFTNTSAPGPLTDVSWYDFGVGGGVGTIKTTDTVYTWTQAGSKNVRLTVANCVGYSAEKLKVVTVYADNRPVVADFSPTTGNVGTPVTFTAVTGVAYGNPDTFTWQFDDEPSPRTGAAATRTFECSKQVGLTLTVASSTRGKTASTKKTVVISGSPQCCTATTVPTADFVWSPNGPLTYQGMQQQQPYAGQGIQFGGTSTGNPTAWRWDFGNGQIRSEQNPTFTWATAGSYQVSLSATNCFGSSLPTIKAVTIYADVRPVTADFSCTPASPSVGVAVTCTAAEGFDYGDPDSFDWAFPGGVKKTGKSATFAFSCGGANAVSLVARRGSTASPSVTKTITSVGTPSCCRPPNRASAPSPAAGATVPGGTVVLSWARPSQGTDPLRYDVYLSTTSGSLTKLPECTNLTTLQCVATVLDSNATQFWKVVAKNDCGDTTTYPDTPPEWRFKACSASGAPDATTFTYSPTGAVEVMAVVQQQPYVGQQVTFSYAPTVPATSWSWTDEQSSPGVSYEVAHPTVVYSSPGDKKMYLRAGNCAGTRSITQYVHVYEDIRPVVAAFTHAPEYPDVGDKVTLTALDDTDHGNPNQFTWNVGSGDLILVGRVVEAIFPKRGTYPVTLTAKRGSASDSVTRNIEVGCGPCGCSVAPTSYIVAAAHTTGVNSTRWRSDLDIANPLNTEALVQLYLFRANQANPNPDTTRVTIPAHSVLRLPDVLDGPFFTANAALGIQVCSGEADVNSRFYNTGGTCSGATYGMFVPAEDEGNLLRHGQLGLLHHLSYSVDTKTGFRTNIGFVNGSSHAVDVVIKLFGDNGVFLGSKVQTLQAFEHRQITRIHLEMRTPAVSAGHATIEVLTADGEVHAYAMLIDNVSGDPIYIPLELW